MSERKLSCPVSMCQAENAVQATVCRACGAPLHGYSRLIVYPSYLFNLGLRAARAGQFTQARDMFAAVIHWYPTDLQARNAFACACLELGDLEKARQQWKHVLTLSPENALASKGLLVIAQREGLQAQIKTQEHPGQQNHHIRLKKLKRRGKKRRH